MEKGAVFGFVFLGLSIILAAAVSSNYPFPGNFDSYTGALQMMENEHYQCHRGNCYSFTDYIDGINADENRTYILYNNHTIHLRAYSFIPSANPINVSIYFNATVSANGTYINHTSNRNLYYPKDYGEKVYLGPTVTDFGTYITGDSVLGTKQDATDIQGVQGEWIIPANSTTLFYIQNLDSNGVNLRTHLFWYELD